MFKDLNKLDLTFTLSDFPAFPYCCYNWLHLPNIYCSFALISKVNRILLHFEAMHYVSKMGSLRKNILHFFHTGSFLHVVIILDVLSEHLFGFFQFTDLFSLSPKFSWTTLICLCMGAREWFPKSFLLTQMPWVVPLHNTTWSPAALLNNNLVAGWKTSLLFRKRHS